MPVNRFSPTWDALENRSLGVIHQYRTTGCIRLCRSASRVMRLGIGTSDLPPEIGVSANRSPLGDTLKPFEGCRSRSERYTNSSGSALLVRVSSSSCLWYRYSGSS